MISIPDYFPTKTVMSDPELISVDLCAGESTSLDVIEVVVPTNIQNDKVSYTVYFVNKSFINIMFQFFRKETVAIK